MLPRDLSLEARTGEAQPKSLGRLLGATKGDTAMGKPRKQEAALTAQSLLRGGPRAL